MSEQDQKLTRATLGLLFTVEEVGLALLDGLSKRFGGHH